MFDTFPMRRLAVAVLSLALLAAGCIPAAKDPYPTIWTPDRIDRTAEQRWQREALAYLASPYLEGRGPGTRGLDLAADYIAEQFRKAGIPPVPGHGYFQTFDYVTGLKPDASTFLTLGGQQLAADRDFRPATLTARDRSFSGDVVFVGYGIASRAQNYDDFDGVDLTGKVALMLRYEPRNAEGTSRFSGTSAWSAEAALARKVNNAQSRGAVAVLLVNPPPLAGTLVDDEMPRFLGRGARGGVNIPVLHVSRAAADRALATVGTRLTDLANAIDSTGRPASRPLTGLSARGQLRLVPDAVPVRNVIAMLPGHGSLAREYVVVGAHYDHLGFGGPGSLAPGVNAVHPGADDNASGTVTLMTLAKRLAAESRRLQRLPDGGPDRRAILFQAYTVEEQGLLGSQYWVEHPTVPLENVAYMVNLDMVGRLRNDTLTYGGDGTSAIFADVLARAFEGSGLTGRSFGRGGLGPSDHASFAARKIPVLFLFTGLHNDYHRPSDTPSTLNYDGMQRVTDVAERILTQLRSAPRMAYNDEADRQRQNINRAAPSPSTPTPPSPTPTPAPSSPTPTPPVSADDAPVRERVGLGLMPDMALRDRGMRIDAVAPGSAAERAGLRGGDILLQLDGTPIDSVEDLQAVYDRHAPGDTVTAVYERDGQQMETRVTFTRRAPRP
ncbi:MAG: M28 family peptidase [Tepidisphaerales bacterium]